MHNIDPISTWFIVRREIVHVHVSVGLPFVCIEFNVCINVTETSGRWFTPCHSECSQAPTNCGNVPVGGDGN